MTGSLHVLRQLEPGRAGLARALHEVFELASCLLADTAILFREASARRSQQLLCTLAVGRVQFAASCSSRSASS